MFGYQGHIGQQHLLWKMTTLQNFVKIRTFGIAIAANCLCYRAEKPSGPGEKFCLNDSIVLNISPSVQGAFKISCLEGERVEIRMLANQERAAEGIGDGESKL